MPDVSTGIGLRHVRIGLRNSEDGVMELPSTHTVGTAYPGIQLSGATTLTLNAPEPERVPAPGDDRIYHTFHGPPTEGWTGELVTTKQDLDGIAMVTGATKWGESSLFEGIAMGTDKEGDEPDLILWAQRQAADTDPESSSFGETIWEAFELVCVKMTPMPASKEKSTVGEHRYAITLQQAARRITGESFDETNYGCTKATFFPVVSKTGKVFYDFDQGNGTETEFVLTHTPTSATDIKVYVAGTDEPTGWSLDVGTKTVTFTSAPDDGDSIVFLYSTDDTL
jgi:hypothetical protein